MINMRGYATMIIALVTTISFAGFFLILYFLNIFSEGDLFFAGGASTGSVGIGLSLLSQLQDQNRIAKVFGHLHFAKDDPNVLLVSLRNVGLRPGKNVQCMMVVNAKHGTYSIKKFDGTDPTDISIINITKQEERWYQFDVDVVYPDVKSLNLQQDMEHDEVFVGSIGVIESPEGELAINVRFEVQEESAKTVRSFVITKETGRQLLLKCQDIEKAPIFPYY